MRGDDYCIISGAQKIILGMLNVNTNTPLATFTGSSSNNMLFSGRNNQINVGLQEIYLSGLENILGFYNFDRILLADNQTDFSPIQSGNNWRYVRSPK